MLSSCGSDAKPSGPDPTLDEQYPARAYLSDAGHFHVVASFSIGPSDAGATLSLNVAGANLSNDPMSAAFGSGLPMMQLGLSLPVTVDEMVAAANGSVTPLQSAVDHLLTYGEPGRQVVRRISDVQVVSREDKTITISLALSEGVVQREGESSVPGLGEASVMEVSGTVPVVCMVGEAAGAGSWVLSEDPNFATEFCRNALDEFGLRAIREAQL